jgi:DNA-binding transcriptional LysR family regulator
MTQPPLTQAIQGLERQLGVPLFARTRRSVALTPAGLALLPAVRRLLAAAEALPQVAQAAAAGLAGQLRLAFVSSVAYGPLPEWLRSFRQAHPDVVLQLREATLDVQLAAFDADEIDAGFLLHAPGAVPPGFAAWPALTEPLVMALPASHLAAKACADTRQRFTKAVACGDCPALLGLAARRRNSLRAARSAQTAAVSQSTKRASRVAASPALLGALEAHCRVSAHAFAEAMLARHRWRSHHPASRQAVPGGGDLCGGEERRFGVGAQSALRN